MPAHVNMVLMSPVFGEPRIDQATPATRGGTNSGIMLAAAMNPLQGVLVRTTIHENVSPMTTASTRAAGAGDERVGECHMDVGVAENRDEIVERDVDHAEPVHHRIGVGQRPEQQHRDRIDDQKRQDQQRAGPQPAGDDAKLCRPFGPCGRRDKCGGLCGHDPPLWQTWRPIAGGRLLLLTACLSQKAAPSYWFHGSPWVDF